MLRVPSSGRSTHSNASRSVCPFFFSLLFFLSCPSRRCCRESCGAPGFPCILYLCISPALQTTMTRSLVGLLSAALLCTHHALAAHFAVTPVGQLRHEVGIFFFSFFALIFPFFSFFHFSFNSWPLANSQTCAPILHRQCFCKLLTGS